MFFRAPKLAAWLSCRFRFYSAGLTRYPSLIGGVLLQGLLLGSVMAGVVLLGCGYSEDEWQAQLARYSELSAQNKHEQEEHAKDKAALAEAQAKVAGLSEELSKMGVDVETLSRKLVEEGTEKERLSADVDELKRAVQEYQARAAQLERIRGRFEVLRGKLQKLTKLGLKVEVRHNRMVISLPGDVLFPSGKDQLRDGGKDVLIAVADVIRNDATLAERFFQVAGHTDAQPLKGGQFKDNWGLSAMRARTVLVFLISPVNSKDGGGGLDPSRLHAAGYGDTDPVAGNEAPAEREKNRRVELVLMPNIEEMLDLKSLI
jgi:chemotaxis protein MotB